MFRRPAALLAIVLATAGLSVAGTGGASAESASTPARSFQAGLFDAGGAFGCAIDLARTVRCWGEDDDGQLGTAGPDTAIPQVVPGITSAVNVSAGGDHACAVLADHTIRCWGFNANGQLGRPTAATSSATPVAVQGIANAVSVSAGASSTCALLADHTVRCWGYNGSAQIGAPANGGTPNYAPNLVPGITTAVAVAAGYYHSCAVLADRTMRCWGSNSSGELGTTSGVAIGAITATPVTPNISNAIGVSAGQHDTCAVLSTGAVSCWGQNNNGQIGRTDNMGTYDANPTPVTVGGISTAVGIALEDQHACAALADGSAKCWGSGGASLGNAAAPVGDTATPVIVTGLAGALAVSVGGGSSFALVSDGTLRSWGNNAHGRLGRDQGLESGQDFPDEAAVPLPALGGRAADLSLTAVANGATAVRIGQTSQVLLTLHNDGPDAANPQVWVGRDSALAVATTSSPSTYTTGSAFDRWSPGSLASGASASVLITVSATATGTHSVSAEVGLSDAVDPDSLPGNSAAGEDDQAAVPFAISTVADALKLAVSHSGRNVGATARLVVTRAAVRAACTGAVSIAFKQGKKTVTRKAALKLGGDGSCAAKASYKALKAGKVTIKASYAGSAVLAPISSKPTSVTVH